MLFNEFNSRHSNISVSLLMLLIAYSCVSPSRGIRVHGCVPTVFKGKENQQMERVKLNSLADETMLYKNTPYFSSIFQHFQSVQLPEDEQYRGTKYRARRCDFFFSRILICSCFNAIFVSCCMFAL